MLSSLAFSLIAATVVGEGVAAGVALIRAPLIQFENTILPFSLPLCEPVLARSFALRERKTN
jgi:hypothetical protein